MTQATTPGDARIGLGTAQKIGLGVLIPCAAAGVTYGMWRLVRVAQEGTNAAELGALYDDHAAREYDPALLRWQEMPRIETGMNSVHGFALLKDGRIAVVGERLIRVLASDGAKLLDIPLAGVPQTIAASDDNLLYVGLKDHVEVYRATGEKLAGWNSWGPDAFLSCITVRGDDVYVADAGRRVIVHADSSGHVVGELGTRDESKHVRGIVAPSPHLDVAVAGDGLVWVSNPGRHQLEAYNASGDVVRMWGEAGTTIDKFSGCCNPTDFAILPDGRFVTTEKGIPRVKIYSRDGTFESVVAGPESFAEDTAGIDVTVDPLGRILIADPMARAIRVFVPK